MAERGENPIASLAEAAIDRRDTVSALVEDYVKWARENIRSWRNAKWCLERHIVPAWGERPVGTITQRDATSLVTEVSRGPVDPDTGENSPRPGAGSEVRKWGATIFEWARQRHRIRTNPFSDVAAPRLKRRQRFLRIDEARAVYQAAMTLDAPWSQAIRMLMLTGCRENEICRARWSWLDSNGHMLLVPPEHYKTGRPFMVLLSSQARQILDSIPRLNEGDFIFSTTNGAKPVAGIPRKMLDKLHHVAEAMLGAQSATPVVVDHFRLHDLRRTVRTHLARLGVSEIVAELVLGHTIKGVHGTYNVYDFAEEKRAALVHWAQELEHTHAAQ
jgi:integrase